MGEGSTPSDRELVAAVIAREPGAAGAFLDRFWRFIVAVAGQYHTINYSLASTVPQEVLLKLWEADFRRLRAWRGDGDFASYLGPIVRRAALDELRSRWRTGVVVVGLPGQDDGGEELERRLGALAGVDGGVDDRLPIVLRYLETLDAEDRKLLGRKFLEGESSREIGESTGRTANAVDQAVFRALGRLRRLLRHRHPELFSPAPDERE